MCFSSVVSTVGHQGKGNLMASHLLKPIGALGMLPLLQCCLHEVADSGMTMQAKQIMVMRMGPLTSCARLAAKLASLRNPSNGDPLRMWALSLRTCPSW